MKVKKDSEKVGLKLNIQKTKIMASGLFISWQIDGEAMETMRDYFLGSKSLQMVTAAIKLKKKKFASWKKSYAQSRQHVKKQRHYFADKDLSNQS